MEQITRLAPERLVCVERGAEQGHSHNALGQLLLGRRSVLRLDEKLRGGGLQ